MTVVAQPTGRAHVRRAGPVRGVRRSRGTPPETRAGQTASPRAGRMSRRFRRTRRDGAMRAVVRGIAWLGILIGICVAPLAFALMSTNRPGQGFWTDFSVALGFVGLALMGMDLALVARVKAIAEP